MKLKLSHSLILAVFLTLLACGGGGGGNVITNSPFAGTWLGTWQSPSTSEDGTLNVTIGTNGQWTGTVHNNQANIDGTTNGTVQNNGQFSGNYQYPGQQAVPLTGTIALSGGGNTLSGNLTATVGQNQYPMTFTATRQ